MEDTDLSIGKGFAKIFNDEFLVDPFLAMPDHN